MKEKEIKLLVLPSVSNLDQVIENFPFPISLTTGHFKDLEIIFHDGETTILHKGVDLKDFSFIWLCSSWGSRDLAYALQLYLDKNTIPHTLVEKGTSKLTDHMIFSLKNISSPNTLFFGHKNIENNFDQIRKVCGYPLIIKDTKGSRGAHSVKVLTEEDLLKKVKILPKHKKYLFQQYIPNDYDWGIMVADGVVVSGEKSYPCFGEFRNNVCNGAKEIFVDPNEIPQNIKKIAIETSDALGLSWSRSDIIIEQKTQTPYVLEINRLPGITSKTSEVSGAYTFLSSQMAMLA